MKAKRVQDVRIQTRDELVELKRKLGVGGDWHEPDNQNVTATVAGKNLDNAGFWPPDWMEELEPAAQEMTVTLWQDVHDVVKGEDTRVRVADINLATLLAWASNEDEQTACNRRFLG